MHEGDEIVTVPKLSKAIFVLIVEGKASPHGKALTTYRGFEVVAWKLVDVFEMVTFKTFAPILMKALG